MAYKIASKASSLNFRYEQLENEVEKFLIDYINTYGQTYKDYDSKCIKVDIFSYNRLTYLNNELIFLDKNGYQYSIDTIDLSDLIDITMKIEID